MKPTEDKEWIKKYGTDRVDIAGVDYFSLPSDWQRERLLGAKIALEAVIGFAKEPLSLDSSFVEKISEILHSRWLDRNNLRADETQKLPYAQLPESEKEKDRFFVRRAIEAYLIGKQEVVFDTAR